MTQTTARTIPLSIVAEPVIDALARLEGALAYAQNADNQYMNAQPIIGVCEHHAPIIERVRICRLAVFALRDILEAESDV